MRILSSLFFAFIFSVSAAAHPKIFPSSISSEEAGAAACVTAAPILSILSPGGVRFPKNVAAIAASLHSELDLIKKHPTALP